MAKAPNRPDPAAGGPSPRRAKPAAPRKAAPRGAGKAAFKAGMAGRAWGGGPSWLAVIVIVLAALVILPIAAAVLGDVWAVVLGALIGGFALGRATAR
ncbi:hypothetical protein D9599_01435 [Roseomonas sp. KE2513]|uniref:hypothetical protein n=1 Tax=Roseomonas sp. KE2513 TaxID=2479202 RepID=UPI0018DFD01F|nr:hypothetical protein [Roseomonas sp. KE2513]MBI0534237.1 hypothetical protein [Roseomonas sp. KE2513]